MKKTCIRLAVVLSALALTGAPAAFAEPVPVPTDDNTQTVCNECGRTYRVATTNGVPTTINNPKNVGGEDACKLTFECRDANNNQVGTSAPLSPGSIAHSFSCGAAAAKIVVVCDDDGTECKYSYTKPGTAATDQRVNGQLVKAPDVVEFVNAYDD